MERVFREELLTAQMFMKTARSWMFLSPSLKCEASLKVMAESTNISLNVFNNTCREMKAFAFELNLF